MSAFAALKGSIFKAIGLCADLDAYHPHLTPGAARTLYWQKLRIWFRHDGLTPFDFAKGRRDLLHRLGRAAPAREAPSPVALDRFSPGQPAAFRALSASAVTASGLTR
jgi:hypothetical protein